MSKNNEILKKLVIWGSSSYVKKGYFFPIGYIQTIHLSK